VSDEATTPEQRDGILTALLARPSTILTAIVSDGVLVPMPASVGVPPDRVLPAPTDRATLAELVVSADTMMLIATWERARGQGVALGTVRMRHQPGQAVALTFVDARDEHGVYLCGLDAVESDDGAHSPEVLEALAVSRRPRTATVTKNALAVITDVDERATRMLGWTREQMVGKRSSDFVHPDDQERAIANWMELLSRQESQRIRLRHRRADGTWVWVELENQYEPADDPGDAVVVAQMSDISDEMAAHEALQQRERLLRRVADSLPVGILQLTTEGGLVYANSRLAEILGVPEVTGAGQLEDAVSDGDRGGLRLALAETLEAQADAELEVELRPLDGADCRICAVSFVSLSDREGAPGALVCVTDVTDSARMREELTAKATFDELTGCYNRSSTMAFLEQALRDRSGPTTVLFVDLDNFKPVNDTLGHDAGDEVLVETAGRLTSVLRRDDIVGRIGGDEFLIVSRGLQSPEAALAMGGRVQDVLAAPAVLAGGPVELRASIGIACSEPGQDALELIRRADQAMYLSKKDGRGRPMILDGGA
jgi:diguanylate cyclase (GGDEF)-like protein/PAS domain S-box-containing protein